MDFTKFNSTATGDEWKRRCVNALPSPSILTRGLVTKDGSNMTDYSSATWGIAYSLCQALCNTTHIPLMSTVKFQDVAQSLTTYLLPWLALTAQLPYESGGHWTNFMSFCMAVGSPALATYSLTLTTLNRYYLRRRLETLKLSYNNVPDDILALFDYARDILGEAQQVPLRASQQSGWLSSLIVSHSNRGWWKRTAKSLRDSRRGPTFSLYAQVGFAVLAWLFIIISAFQVSLGEPAVALHISSGSVWLWMLPVIGGWILVGTQYSHDTIENALKKDKATLVMLRTESGGPSPSQDDKKVQLGIIIESTETATSVPEQTETEPRELSDMGSMEQTVTEPREQINTQPMQQTDPQGLEQTVNGPMQQTDPEELELEALTDERQFIWLEVDVRGDERLKGPTFNYARIFTWYRFSTIIVSALKNTMDKIEKTQTVRSIEANQPSTNQGNSTGSTAWGGDMKQNFSGDPEQLAKYCGLDKRDSTLPYVTFSRMRRDPSNSIGARMLLAATCAFVVQWGTTGAAIIIGYFTPVVGIGCRSGSYFIYGVLATAGWVSLVLAMIFSHQAMLRHKPQAVLHESQPNNGEQQIGEPRRPLSFRLFATLAVILWLFGRLVVILNTFWLIASSLMEIIGVFDNCWCNAHYPSLGDKGWILLFKGATDLKADAQGSWGGGIALSVTIALGSFGMLLLGTKKWS